jgi:uroporphyrinogen-III synthase
LIIKGTHGRDLLQQELVRRGAAVVCAEVYERVPAAVGAAALETLRERFAAGEVQVITATSLEIGAELLKLATLELRREFERVHWLVPGERVASGLRKLGLEAPLLQADSAEDQDLAGALIRWRANVSDAGSKES